MCLFMHLKISVLGVFNIHISFHITETLSIELSSEDNTSHFITNEALSLRHGTVVFAKWHLIMSYTKITIFFLSFIY